MTKSTAHIVFGFFDLAAIAGLGYAISKVGNIWTDMAGLQNPLVVDTGVLYLFLLILLPLLHIMSAIEFFFPKHLKIQNRLGAALIVIFFTLLFGKFVVEYWLINQVESSGYQRCLNLEGRPTRFKKRVYVLDEASCQKNDYSAR